MPASQKIGSNRPLTFLHSGKPVRPYRPRMPDRSPGMKGIAYAGNTSYTDFKRNVRSETTLSPQQLGSKAVELQKFSGISVNTTI